MLFLFLSFEPAQKTRQAKMFPSREATLQQEKARENGESEYRSLQGAWDCPRCL
jgi:hypothetical protein